MSKILNSLKGFIKRQLVLLGVDIKNLTNRNFDYIKYLTSGEKVLVVEKIPYEYRINPLIQYSVSEHYYRYYTYMSYSRNRMKQNNICCFMMPLDSDIRAKAFLTQTSIYKVVMEQFLKLDDIKTMGSYTRDSIIDDLICYLEICSYTCNSDSFDFISADLVTYHDVKSLVNKRIMDIETINYVKSGFRFPKKLTQAVNEPEI